MSVGSLLAFVAAAAAAAPPSIIDPAAVPPEFVCPDCLAPSWRRADRRRGWCPRCRDVTAAPDPTADPTAGPGGAG
jgi:hypothetical protein